eukprot:scaffold266945_cov35-Prasinocladus_malaysianus.AAC.1
MNCRLRSEEFVSECGYGSDTGVTARFQQFEQKVLRLVTERLPSGVPFERLHTLFFGGPGVEGEVSAQELVKNHAGSPQVNLRAERGACRISSDHFRGEVLGSATRDGHPGAFGHVRGQAQIYERGSVQFAGLTQDNVGCLDVAVGDTVAVQAGDALENSTANDPYIRLGQRYRQVVQIAPFQQLEHQGNGLGGVDFIDDLTDGVRVGRVSRAWSFVDAAAKLVLLRGGLENFLGFRRVA